ncbi:hypothetical protein JXM67_12280 [candidate division WOR-3 bacterium]|nr:hypothetical protein [candidate division WOR-3 bacterium]
MSKQTRKAFQDKDAGATFDKYAVVRTIPATRMMAKIILAVRGKLKHTQFFKTDKEAVAWIKREAYVESRISK